MLEENNVPFTPVEPIEPAKVWISIERRGFITGYGSSEISDSICFNKSDLPEGFEIYFSFYRLNENLELVYDDTLVKEINSIQEEEANKPTQEELMEALINENRALKDRVTFTEDALMDLILTRGVEI